MIFWVLQGNMIFYGVLYLLIYYIVPTLLKTIM